MIPILDDALEFRELNRQTRRIHVLGVEHSMGIHAYSLPCMPECPREEITHSQARDRAGLFLQKGVGRP